MSHVREQRLRVSGTATKNTDSRWFPFDRAVGLNAVVEERNAEADGPAPMQEPLRRQVHAQESRPQHARC
jgi:hypothetical protein